MSRPLTYAGIGARDTPEEVCRLMASLAEQLSDLGWHLRSGHAKGADQAFGNHAHFDKREIHLPFENYEGGHTSYPGFIVPTSNAWMEKVARDHHPVWHKLSSTVRCFMIRNVSILLGACFGAGGDDPVDMVICWTKNGKIAGGTGHAMRIASTFQIPLFNLALEEDKIRLDTFVAEKG